MNDRLPLAVVSRSQVLNPWDIPWLRVHVDCLHEPNYLGFHEFRPF